MLVQSPLSIHQRFEKVILIQRRQRDIVFSCETSLTSEVDNNEIIPSGALSVLLSSDRKTGSHGSTLVACKFS